MPGPVAEPFRHALLRYEDAAEVAAAAAPFIIEGSESDDVLALCVSPAVRDALASSPAEGAVGSAYDLGDAVSHPHQLLWTLCQLGAEAADRESAVRVVFETDAAAMDPIDWVRAECVANECLSLLPIRGLCIRDASAVDHSLTEELERAHPTVLGAGGSDVNPSYVETRDQLRELDSRYSPDPVEVNRPTVTIPLHGIAELAEVRTELDGLMDVAAIATDRQEDFAEGVFQVCTNALMHGGPRVEVRLWSTPETLLCRVRDSGAGLTDPLMGYLPPVNGWLAAGSGLWTARQLCDHLTTTAEPFGFTVRMSVRV